MTVKSTQHADLSKSDSEIDMTITNEVSNTEKLAELPPLPLDPLNAPWDELRRAQRLEAIRAAIRSLKGKQ